jgi:L-threonylcarbamoyladenylate synthase
MNIISNCTPTNIKDAALALKNGNLVAFPTETVYGIGADATNYEAVLKVYEVKGRPKDHPLIIHLSSIELLDKWARHVPKYAMELARQFWPGPMTLVLPKTDLAKDFVTGNQDSVAVRIPANKIAAKLLKEFELLGGVGVAAPSANRFGKVSPTTSQAVVEELEPYLSTGDQILDGGFSEFGIESTIIDCTGSSPIILRPGSITLEMLESFFKVEFTHIDSTKRLIKFPGSMNSHYAPNARVHLSGTPKVGDGFIALHAIPTPFGVIRLASPENQYEFAKILYSSLRLADSMQLKSVFVVPPEPVELGTAIVNRLNKMR